jgi:hypothetical protein
MPGVLDTFRAFRRRLAAPRVLSPVLPARRPRRCRKCGGLIIPDRSRRYSFARPELVDAMGIQIKPGAGVSFKKGAGVIVADSTKPCCCTPADCGCTFCSGVATQATCLSAVVSSVDCCDSGSSNDLTFSGTFLLRCPGVTPAFVDVSHSLCTWSFNSGAVSENFCDVAGRAYWVRVRNAGSGVLHASVIPLGGSNPGSPEDYGDIFRATATTTAANACTLASAVTFTNDLTCSDSFGTGGNNGTMVVQATTCP